MAITNRNKKVIDPGTLLKYLEKLPLESELSQRLTKEKFIRLKIYCNELVKIKEYIDEAQTDIAINKGVEIFTQGEQSLRRRNPAMGNFLELERMYFTLFNRVERIIDGEIRFVDDIWK